MKNIVRAAAIAVTLLLSSIGSVAFAADQQDTPPVGHFEWRSQPAYGPRARMRPPVRVWVADGRAMASSDCAMMDGAGAADCMAMPTRRKPVPQG